MAKVVRRRRVRLQEAEGGGQAQRPGLTWDDAVESFLKHEEFRGLRQRTVELDAQELRLFRRWLDGRCPGMGPADVTEEVLADYVIEVRSRGAQPRTINIKRQTLIKFFGFLASKGWLPANPAQAIPKQREGRKLPRALQDDEVRRLLRQPDQRTFVGLRDYAMIALLLDTGMRSCEILDLRMHQIDLRRRLILLPSTTKDREERAVYFSSVTASHLSRYLKERGETDTDHVFVSWEGRPLHRKSFYRNLAEYGRRAGVKVSPHKLRHTFARGYIMNGGDPFSLQKQLGHADMSTVELYVGLWGNDLQAQHAKFTPTHRWL